MSTLRVPFAVVAGATFSSVVFLALWQFISVPLRLGEPVKAQRIEFTRQIPDTPPENKRDPKIDRPPPPIVPTSARTQIGDPPTLEPTEYVRPRIDIAQPRRDTGMGGVDRDAIPVVRVPPDYPPRAVAANIEGWVQVQFSVTAAGTVRDPLVVAAEPRGWFEEAALKAIARWRYNPRVDAGVAVERVGLQTVIRFQLPK